MLSLTLSVLTFLYRYFCYYYFCLLFKLSIPVCRHTSPFVTVTVRCCLGVSVLSLSLSPSLCCAQASLSVTVNTMNRQKPSGLSIHQFSAWIRLVLIYSLHTRHFLEPYAIQVSHVLIAADSSSYPVSIPCPSRNSLFSFHNIRDFNPRAIMHQLQFGPGTAV